MAYTYLIGWSEHDKWYYGVRTSKFSRPDDLWVDYFTSSKHVKSFHQQNGEPDVIEVRKVFADPKQALLWEGKVLKKMKVISSERWLNKTDNKLIDAEAARLGSLKGNQTKQLYGMSESAKQKMKESSRKRWDRGGMSEETKAKLSAVRKGKPKPEGFGEKIRQHRLGKPSPTKGKKFGRPSDETIKKISEATKGRIPWNKGLKKKA